MDFRELLLHVSIDDRWPEVVQMVYAVQNNIIPDNILVLGNYEIPLHQNDCFHWHIYKQAGINLNSGRLDCLVVQQQTIAFCNSRWLLKSLDPRFFSNSSSGVDL